MHRPVLRPALLALALCTLSPVAARGDMPRAVAGVEAASEGGAAAAEEVRRLRAEARSVPDGDASNAYWGGRVAMIEQDWDQAMVLFSRACELDPGEGRYHRWAGHACIAKLQNAGMFSKRPLAKKAIECFHRAVEVAPRDLEAREALAQYYLQAPSMAGGNRERGMEQVEAIRSQDPVQAATLLGWYYNARKNFERAAREFDEGLRLAPDDPGAHYDRAVFQQSRENWTEAFHGFQEAWNHSADSQERRIRIIHAAALYQLGRTSAFSGERLEDGVRWMEAYLQRDVGYGEPDKAHAYGWLGLIHEHRQDRDAARTAYRRAVELDPANEQARDARRRWKQPE